jgi:WD40 repeat protein
VIIWDLLAGVSIDRLLGHTKAVTSIVVFDPKDGSSPVLVTASLGMYIRLLLLFPKYLIDFPDRNIIVWDLLEREIIRKLPIEGEVGHSGKINSVSVFDKTSDEICPLIVSCGEVIYILLI